jgi:general nucleoside transport system permease protein
MTATRSEASPDSAATPPPAARRRPSMLSGSAVRFGADAVIAYATAIAAALLVSSLIIVLVGGSPLQVTRSMLEGSLGSRVAFAETINQATPVLLVAIGTIVAYRAGVFNIGQEGQFIIGALAGAAVGTKVSVITGIPLLIGILLASCAGGALWALLAAVMKYARGVHETVTTLLLNLVAYQLVSFAVNRQYLLQMSGDSGSGNLGPQTDPIPRSARLATPFSDYDLRFHVGIFIGIAAAIVLAMVLKRTVWGYGLRMLGENPIAAHRAGVSAAIAGGAALVISGAVIGLGGGVLLSGTVFRVQSGFTTNLGWEGLLVAQIALRRPIPAIWVSLLWGALTAGGGFLVATGLTRDLVNVVKALVVLALLVPPIYLEYRARRRAVALAVQGASA